jgi:hypothetical protein
VPFLREFELASKTFLKRTSSLLQAQKLAQNSWVQQSMLVAKTTKRKSNPDATEMHVSSKHMLRNFES